MSLTPSESLPAEPDAPARAKGKRLSVASKATESANQLETPAKHGAVSITQLTDKLSTYLTPADLVHIREAFRFSDQMHVGQMRRSGEPYISHPIAVAEICADWKLDAQAIMAALLHDVMEDQDVKKEELHERFGAQVASLVDGLSKLEKIEFQSQIEAQAENFRKMLLAMARDVRVILVKLADRLHNMRTLGVMLPEKKRRIARETMEVYVPIAHRLGLNNIYRELQDLSFSYIFPLRHRTLSKAVKAARGNRREVVGKILEAVNTTLANAGIKAEVHGREKTLYGIYRKMQEKRLSFSQVLDVYGFRVVVNSFNESYYALGVLHGLYKPMPGKFKDYIAMPKLNGYQSLHTTLVGPYGTPVEFQIRTQDMHHIAESGVAAHWLYKDKEVSLSDLQVRTHAWLQSLLDIQKQTGDSAEFLEHVKVDLFPDSVYVFTPKSKIIALSRGATALDFAYTIHTDIGDQTIAAKINHEAAPLRTELRSGDIVEIITSPSSRPTPNWLSYVRTGKARSAIRHYLRTANLTESTELGRQLLSQSLALLNLNADLPNDIIEKLLFESKAKTMEDLYADIGAGRRMSTLVARHILDLIEDEPSSIPFLQLFTETLPSNKLEPVVIYGSEGISVELATCCLAIPGDEIIGQLKRDQGLVVHTCDCQIGKRLLQKEPERWIDVAWGKELNRRFDCKITIFTTNERGALARVAAEIGDSDANIINVEMEGSASDSLSQICFTIQVEGRKHLARLMRNVRHIIGVSKILRGQV